MQSEEFVRTATVVVGCYSYSLSSVELVHLVPIYRQSTEDHPCQLIGLDFLSLACLVLRQRGRLPRFHSFFHGICVG